MSGRTVRGVSATMETERGVAEVEDLAKFDRAALERRLKNLEEELDELEEEKSFVLRQTGLHVGGGKVKQYDAQTKALQESIAELRAELASRAS